MTNIFYTLLLINCYFTGTVIKNDPAIQPVSKYTTWMHDTILSDIIRVVTYGEHVQLYLYLKTFCNGDNAAK